MDNRPAAIETLRSEYDGRLLDPVERKQQAKRLYSALMTAGLWPAHPRVLDVGCGTGFKLSSLGENVTLRVGCDIRRENYLNVSDAVGNIKFVQASATEMPFPEESFDMVTCISVIEEFPDFRAAIAEMARCVAKGGVLVINVTNGVLLQPLYQLAEMAGKKIPESWWHYATASKPIVKANPDRGYHIACLEGWHYIHLTPYIIRSQFPLMKYFPISLLDIVSRCLTPTFVHAWKRPSESDEGRK